MIGIALFALALLGALVAGSLRRHALATGWRRGLEWSPAASPRPAHGVSPSCAGRTAGSAPRRGSSGPVAKAA